MKRTAKCMLRWTAEHLPYGVGYALLSGYADKLGGRYRLLQQLATEQGISGFVVHGDYGFIQGPVADTVILRHYAMYKTWSATTNDRFANFLRKGGTYLDIGANIGLTTISIARNPHVACVVFEPDPIIFRMLRANIIANCQYGNVTVHNFALHDRDTVVTLRQSPINTGDNRIWLNPENGESNQAEWPAVEVTTRRLDDLDTKARTPLAVKIDTQGSEPFVISGGQQFLKTAGLMAVEFWPYGMRHAGGKAQTVIKFLRSNFNKGVISPGDQDDWGDWQHIDVIAVLLEELAQKSDSAEYYYDVLVKK